MIVEVDHVPRQPVALHAAAQFDKCRLAVPQTNMLGRSDLASDKSCAPSPNLRAALESGSMCRSGTLGALGAVLHLTGSARYCAITLATALPVSSAKKDASASFSAVLALGAIGMPAESAPAISLHNGVMSLSG
ncbi:MAG: hypothetical protein K8F92_14445 [Hyphomicrobium sp.]|uniref:hypothetical protein n=1 Tax=Hyphomicrobium sp. TaxID=82 RepID=UPI0013231ABB|nr:hypothetical protein [Hyphomicrobium sp.]KAB2937034.1 MAG: hypothetical protein F9K20_20630 [Hyphomicrobium sp.]MBZ0210835.1 hypothetical protein [Hyphomicrobium sp.]